MADHLITTDRLILRPFVAEDTDRVVLLLNDYKVSQWLGRVPHPFTHADCRILNDDGTSRWPDMMAITVNGDVVGCVGVAERLGYWLTPSAWGHGYMSEAVQAALAYVFSTQDREDIRSGYFVGNDASANVLAKAGFETVDVNEEDSVCYGETRPHVNVCLTRAAWEARS